eukprot:604464-Amphidinium_carterae.1
MLDKLFKSASPARPGTPMPAMGPTDILHTDLLTKSPLGLTHAHLRDVEELEKQFHDEKKNSITAAFMPD